MFIWICTINRRTMNTMKKFSLYFAVLALLFSGASKAQEIKDWSKIKPEQRKDLINKMSPEERVELLKKFRENMLVNELDISQDKQNDFRSLYNEYQESQKQIKSRFTPKENYDSMSDEEARRELEQSFEVGEQLMQNRRKFADKFQKVMKPQQVLEMFQNEGMMRNKMIDRKRELRETPGASPYRNNNGNRTRSPRRYP